MGQTEIIGRTTPILYGYGDLESVLNINFGPTQTQAVNAFADPTRRNAKNADYIGAGSYVEFSAPSTPGFYRIWVAIRQSDLQGNTNFYNSENMDRDDQWEDVGTPSIGAISYDLYARLVPLAQNQAYRLVVRSWR